MTKIGYLHSKPLKNCLQKKSFRNQKIYQTMTPHHPNIQCRKVLRKHVPSQHYRLKISKMQSKPCDSHRKLLHRETDDKKLLQGYSPLQWFYRRMFGEKVRESLVPKKNSSLCLLSLRWPLQGRKTIFLNSSCFENKFKKNFQA